MDRFYMPFDREVKLAPDEGDVKMSFSGHGAVFGNVDAYGDVIAPGAFKKTLKEAKQSKQWPAMLMQHGGWGLTSEDLMPIGVWTKLEEDDVGLATEGVLADTTKGLDAYKLLKMKPRPAINGLSIGYIPIKWKARAKPEEPRRTLEEVKLLEVSLVTFPANAKARVRDVKAIDADASRAIKYLGEAIDIHEGHMNGSIDTDEESQQEMMDLMKKAYGALTDKKRGAMNGMKAIEQILTLAEAESFLRDVAGFSQRQAVTFVSRIKGMNRSDSGSLSEVRDALLRRGKAISTK